MDAILANVDKWFWRHIQLIYVFQIGFSIFVVEDWSWCWNQVFTKRQHIALVCIQTTSHYLIVGLELNCCWRIVGGVIALSQVGKRDAFQKMI